MAKITNKQTRATGTKTLNATQHALRENAQAFAAADEALLLGDLTASFAALFTGHTDPAEFRALRTEWVDAYNTARGVVGGAKRFAELVNACGIEKPQSDKAKAEAERRAAARAAAAPEGDASPKDGAGTAAAAKVKMELSAIEAHLLSLLRQSKFEQAAQCVADMAKQAAPF